MSIAVDIQGPSAVIPYIQMFGVKFPVAVDTADIFGQAFGLKAIPVSFLVDEVGIIRLRGAGPTSEFLGQVEEVLKEPMGSTRGVMPGWAGKLSKEALEKLVETTPNDWRARLALARLYSEEKLFAQAVLQLRQATEIQPHDSSIPMLFGLVFLQQGSRETALQKFKLARDLDPENWRIRKQIWAIEHPDKFYTNDAPDYDWQKEELAREKSASLAK